MTRATTKLPEKQPCPEDIVQARRIARQFMNKLERSVANTDELDEGSHDKLFGAKGSLLSGLATITALITELGEVPVAELVETEDDEPKMNEADIAIVRHYVKQAKAREVGLNPYNLPHGISEREIEPQILREKWDDLGIKDDDDP